MKKILYLHAGAELYGADIVLLELLKNLDRKLYDPYVILPCDGPLVEKMRTNNINVKVVPYPILRRKYFSVRGILKFIKDFKKYCCEIKNIIRENPIDIIHTNTAAVLEGAYIRRKFKVAHIWHVHEIIVKPKFINKILSYIIARNSDKVVTVSQAVKEHLEKSCNFEDKINVIYNGVDNSIFNTNNDSEYMRKEFNIPKDAIVVGMIGRVNSWKGQNDFLNAMDTVLRNNKNVYALLVGGTFEGQEWRFEKLKEDINNMETKDRIIISDYRNDVPNIYNLLDIFVLPSINPDPLPTVVLESMASGLPVVGYRHGGICEMVDDNTNGMLCEVRNHHELAEKIEILIKDEVLRNKMGMESLKRQKENFSLNSYVERFSKLYSNVSYVNK